MVTYLPRSAWTSRPASGDTLTGSKLRGVAVHWPGTSQDRIGDPGRLAIGDRLRHYLDYHLSRGWRDIGYNVAIDQAGRVWMLRSTTWRGNLVGAHCASKANPDANEEFVGVLLLLGDSEAPSAGMVDAFRHWFRDQFLVGWGPRTDVRGHQQVPGASTACPGPYALARLNDLTTAPTEDDDMELTDRVNLITGQGVEYSTPHTTVAGILASTNYYVLTVRNQVLAQGARLTALEAKVEAILAKAGFDADELAEIELQAREGAEAALRALIDEARVELHVDGAT
ncbi:MAG TPA: peptidoglycan recognition family protein [Planctomycetota bacterium]|nr:peptidoglycan recognition family protein [Planctomycetota bacterium]